MHKQATNKCTKRLVKTMCCILPANKEARFVLFICKKNEQCVCFCWCVVWLFIGFGVCWSHVDDTSTFVTGIVLYRNLGSILSLQRWEAIFLFRSIHLFSLYLSRSLSLSVYLSRTSRHFLFYISIIYLSSPFLSSQYHPHICSHVRASFYLPLNWLALFPVEWL